MEARPLISIVTVCFNSEPTIGDTMRSVAAQDMPNYEHVVFDACSTDATLEVARALGTARTRIYSEPDAGIYDAMNKGIRAARGEVVCFLNSDDYYSHSRVLSSVARRFSESRADVVYGDIEMVRAQRVLQRVRYWRSGKYLPNKVRLGWHPPHPAFFARRSLLQTLGGFALDLGIAADYELMLKTLLVPQIKVEYLPQCLVQMRQGGRSTDGLQSYLRSNWQSYVAMRRSGLRLPELVVALKPLRKIGQFVSMESLFPDRLRKAPFPN